MTLTFFISHNCLSSRALFLLYSHSNMNHWLILTVVSFAIFVIMADEIDLGLKNIELVNKTVLCLEEKGPCTKFGEKAKVVLTQISRTGVCRSCSEDEQARAYDIIKRFRAQHPALYTRLLARYRPTGVPKDGIPPPLKDLAGDHPQKPLKG